MGFDAALTPLLVSSQATKRAINNRRTTFYARFFGILKSTLRCWNRGRLLKAPTGGKSLDADAYQCYPLFHRYLHFCITLIFSCLQKA